jgi:hypothetical protein
MQKKCSASHECLGWSERVIVSHDEVRDLPQRVDMRYIMDREMLKVLADLPRQRARPISEFSERLAKPVTKGKCRTGLII